MTGVTPAPLPSQQVLLRPAIPARGWTRPRDRHALLLRRPMQADSWGEESLCVISNADRTSYPHLRQNVHSKFFAFRFSFHFLFFSGLSLLFLSLFLPSELPPPFWTLPTHPLTTSFLPFGTSYAIGLSTGRLTERQTAFSNLFQSVPGGEGGDVRVKSTR